MYKKLFKPLLAVVTIALSFAVVVKPAQAVFYGNGYVLDIFQELDIRPDPDAYWHVLNWGDENGVRRIWNDQNCGDSSCITIEGSGFNKYARLKISPDATPGFYTNAELAERNTGFATTEPGKYLPTIDHPVIVTARARWSDNINEDGTGFIGSTGIWLWNSPFDNETNEYGYTESFGFVIAAGANNPIIPGFAVTQSSPSQFPNYMQTIRGVNDIHDWTLLNMKWSQVDANNQMVKYYVNGTKVGETTFANLGALDLEMWQDNQTLNPDTFEIEFLNPAEDQYMDLDFVNVLTL